ncbi:isopentenyl-diphosphate Delta-isomerase [Mesorhizobium retamae]|uniref:Isopentenyl-diphosphate Delta-isomerase n=1 Tax=Mesorhizobium retamae TaxID=2912854 RepID=A0ABS9QM13_9HYPH|nr:isopentenyl-diphosphate Delta-isomerase [Mesorhizobium sp. IRAMC:0171]MCG7508442.1 isopentenyl-diphosphate Delta-isomerase [Mesorhizobium sp. IRAMC:0171]
MDETLILVNDSDEPVGFATKLHVHRKGMMHRAFSILVFDRNGRLLLQRRAAGKYHSAGLWSNSCCGHPRRGEETDVAVHRRLREEMGFDCDLHEVAALIYRAEVSNDLVEHEYDHIYAGVFDGEPDANPDEVSDWQWLELSRLRAAVDAHPGDFTIWLRELLERKKHHGIEQWCALALGRRHPAEIEIHHGNGKTAGDSPAGQQSEGTSRR